MSTKWSGDNGSEETISIDVDGFLISTLELARFMYNSCVHQMVNNACLGSVPIEHLLLLVVFFLTEYDVGGATRWLFS